MTKINEHFFGSIASLALAVELESLDPSDRGNLRFIRASIHLKNMENLMLRWSDSKLDGVQQESLKKRLRREHFYFMENRSAGHMDLTNKTNGRDIISTVRSILDIEEDEWGVPISDYSI